MWIGTACLTVFVVLIPIWGALSDQVGREPLMLLSFDSDHETNELRDGGKSIGQMSWGQFGNP